MTASPEQAQTVQAAPAATMADDLVKLDRLIDDRNRLYKRLLDKDSISIDDAAEKSSELKRIRDRYAWFAEHAWWIKATYAEIAALLKIHAHDIEAAKLAAHPTVAEVLAKVPGAKIGEIAVLSARHAIKNTSQEQPK